MEEYFIFDPKYKLKPPLRVFRLRGKELVEEVVSNNRVVSQELGLELVNEGKTLRLLNPATGEFVRTPAEKAHRAEHLAAKLRELGLDSVQILVSTSM